MRAVNLIPIEQRSGQPVGAGRSQGGAYAVLVLVGGLALMAFLYGQARHQVKSRSAQTASIVAQTQQAQAAAERLAPYTSFIALREQRQQAVNTLVNSRFDWAHVLHELGRVLPSQASISTLSGTIGSSSGRTTDTASVGSSTVASSTPAGAVPTFSLGGCATSQPAVALTLERLRLIDGVKEVSLQSSTAEATGSSSSAAGGCPGRDASFSATIVFEPLPSSSAAAAANKAVSDSTATSSAPAAATTSGGSSK